MRIHVYINSANGESGRLVTCYFAGWLRFIQKCWLFSRNFFKGEIYCYANFFCYANFSIVFGPNFRGKVSEGGQSASGAPLWKKARMGRFRQRSLALAGSRINQNRDFKECPAYFLKLLARHLRLREGRSDSILGTFYCDFLCEQRFQILKRGELFSWLWGLV